MIRMPGILLRTVVQSTHDALGQNLLLALEGIVARFASVHESKGALAGFPLL